MYQKLFSVAVICILLSSMFTGAFSTTRQSQRIAVIYDKSDAATEKAAAQIYAVLSRYYAPIDYIPVSSVKHLEKKLKKQYLGSIYVFHGTPGGMRVGDEELPWDDLSDLLEASPTTWHILESCYSVNLSLQNVHGIGAGVDIELALIDAMHHASEFLGRSGGAEEQTASQGIRKEFNIYVVNNLESIVRKAFLPEKPLDASMMAASTGDKNTTYIFTSPWGSNTTICGDWGWIVDKIIWGSEKIGWIETFDKGGKGYLGFKNFTRTKIEAKKPNMGSGDFNFEMPLKFDVKPSLEKGPWYSPEQVKIKISATPKSKIDLAKITGLSQVMKSQGYDVSFTLVPKISAGIMLQNFSWQGPGLEIDSLQFLGGGMSVEARLELYIPVTTIIGYVVGGGTGGAIKEALDLLGIRADVVAIIDFLDSGDYNATIDASETTIMLLFGIGLLIQGNTDTKGSFLKNAIGVDIPVSFFVLGFKVKGDSGFATRAILDSDGARFQVGVPYELLLDFWARIFYFFKFGWNKEWKDTLWYPPAAKTWTPSADKDNSNLDTDKDGVWDKTELKMGLNASNPDTDGDGLFDGNELTEYYTDPKLNDSDHDGMDDKKELEYWYVEVKHDPLLDYDNDTLPCLLDYDSDGEGLKDGGAPPGTNNTVSEQLGGVGESTFKTDPTLPDTDFDNLTDQEEVNYDWFTWECKECFDVPRKWECEHYHAPELGDIYVCKATNCTCWSDPQYPGYYECWCKNKTTGCGCNCIEMNKTWIYWNVTDPTKKDTDGDMLIDGYEKEYFETLRVTEYGFPFVENGGPYEDFDGDGIVNIIDDDSDNDGLIDGMELLYGTDPLDIDTDGDYDLDNNGIIDENETLSKQVYIGGGWYLWHFGNLNDSGEIKGNWWEGYANWSADPPKCAYPWPVPTDPTKADSDGDGVSDRDEWLNGSVPPNPPIFHDSDADGLSNLEECNTYGTNCTNPDTDFDGLRDGFERDYFKNECGITNNTIMGEYLNDFDVDDDSMIEGLELVYGTDILDPDTDKDGALDGLEFGFYLTDPLNDDTDGDGIVDGDEIEAGTNPLKIDTDDDGLTDYYESKEHETELLFVGNISYKTDPLSPDTDGDGISDGDEVLGWHWAINRIVTNGLFPSSNKTLWGEHVTPEGEWWQWKWNRERVYDFPDPYRARFQTNPVEPDTDRDGLTDGKEKEMVLSPLTDDTDVDGIPDIEEMELIKTIGNETGWPIDKWKRYDIWHYLDFDKDGLSDFNEVLLFDNASWWERRELLLSPDADGDGLTDWEEVRVPITIIQGHFNRTDDGNVCMNMEKYLFNVSMSIANVTEDDLDNGNISAELMETFSVNGYPLSETSQVANVTGEDSEWVITDVITDVGKKFILRKEGESLNVTGIFYNESIIKAYTDPLNPDSDEDGLSDGEEVKVYGTNPLNPDSDEDGLSDYAEAITYDTDPMNPDTDSDGPFAGWNDGIELELWMERGVTAIPALHDYLTDPDADDDGIVDGLEFMNASENPLYSDPLNPDVNANFIIDGYETDYDGDGLTDCVEFYTAPPGYTLPTKASLNDAFNQSESYNATYYNKTIFDATTLRFVNHTCYFIADTDDDGWSDGDEVNIYDTDPLSSSEYPAIIIPIDNLYISSDTILSPGVYNISDSGEPGVIIINADNVVLDCNGATINGTSGIGIFNPGFDNVTIKNGTVQNYETGILLSESDNSTVSNNTVSHSSNQGISIEGSQYCDVYDNRVSFSGDRGITFGGGGNNTAYNNTVYNNGAFGAIEAIYSDNNEIYNNRVYYNEWGIATNHGSGNQIYENTIYGNELGVYLDWPSTNNRVFNNNISSNSAGIKTNHNSTDNMIAHNVLFSNAHAGIHIETDRNTVTSNKANKNRIGIYLAYSHDNNLTNNNASLNSFEGISLANSKNNTIANNTLLSNSYYGIVLWDFSDENTVINNTISGGEYGICLGYSDKNIVANNTIHNSVKGIEFQQTSSNNTLESNTITLGTYGMLIGIHSGDYRFNNILSNTVIGAQCGIYLDECDDSTVFNNDVRSNDIGIYLNASTNDTLTNNTCTNNNQIGLYLSADSTGNTINYNTFCNNLWYDVQDKDSNSGDGNTCDLTDNWNDVGTTGCTYGCVTPTGFDTGAGTYPSVMGNHTGIIKLNQTITVSTIYTYPCAGTGGHTEYAKISNDSWSIETQPWEGYIGDWHNLSFTGSFKLYANETYDYTIRTGSYPQIIHAPSKDVTGGTITCDKFVDANGRIYYDWIPAIKLFL